MSSLPLTRVHISLPNLDHNMGLLAELAGGRTLWPAIKADAYGHGARIIARRLVDSGCTTLCVAHAGEALELREAGIEARFVILSPDLGGAAPEIVAFGFEPVVCTALQLERLSGEAAARNKVLKVHLKVDTGMGRVGFAPDETAAAVRLVSSLPGIETASLMSHFPRADEADKAYSRRQVERFEKLAAETRPLGVSVFHMSNSAAIFDLPEARFDLCRPGISIYGLKPSADCVNPRSAELRPVLSWRTRITQLKEVPAGTGLSYGHSFTTGRPSLIASVPAGYGDGLMRLLSNRMEFLVGGVRCPQVGTICMDQSLIDVTELRGRVAQGDEAVLIGRQGSEEIGADEMAAKLGTINYEIVTRIARRVPRIAVE
jgi:alanine racemase